MPDLEDLVEDGFKAARKISGKAYRAYKKSGKSRSKDKRSTAEKKRDAMVWRIRREVRGRIGVMAALPFLTIAPLVTNLISSQIGDVIFVAGAMAAFAYGLYELRRGLATEADELAAEAISEEPPETVSGPHKLIGLVLLSLGMASFAVAAGQSFGGVLGFGGLTFAAGVLSVRPRGLFGRSQRRTDPQPKLDQDILDSPLGAALVRASDKLHVLYDGAVKIKDEGVRGRALAVHSAAQDVIDELYEDPKDLPKARRFLVTYLDGAIDLVHKYLGQVERGATSDLRAKLSQTLETMTETFDLQLQKLRADEAMDLDVTMDVLETQMKKEGVL